MDCFAPRRSDSPEAERVGSWSRSHNKPPPPSPLFLHKLKVWHDIIRENTYSTVHGFSYPEKDPRVALCRAGKFLKWFFRNGFRAWNGNQCFLFSFREPGSPLSSFVSTDPIAAPCFRWHHEEQQIITRQHWLTDHTVHVSTTTQPYSSVILWTGTTRGFCKC